ncbi:MAG: ATP-grasp domain-containing protein [Candidatus Bathyarchaeota archaeon]|nr:ATP-grasp domain-containing protein [Candidatus Bathyarchaeota archaeon]
MTIRVGILFNSPSKPLRGEEIDYLAEEEVLDQVNAVQEALKRLGIHHHLFPVKDDIEETVKALKFLKPDVVINLCEGFMGDSSLEMHAPSILEILGIPYTGSPPLTLGLCQNKGLAKAVLKACGVPTPNYCVITERNSSLKEDLKDLNFPLIVKPLREDASIGISRRSFVRDYMELKRQVEYIINLYRQPALVEEYIAGREFNVSILGNENPIILPISEIIFDFEDEPKIVDYAAKWLKESEEYAKTKPVCPAKLSSEIRIKVENAALKAYEALGCRDYARVDIRFESKTETPYVLEVNPNPDISPEAGFTRSLKAAGISFEDFIEKILGFALERAGKSLPPKR